MLPNSLKALFPLFIVIFILSFFSSCETNKQNEKIEYENIIFTRNSSTDTNEIILMIDSTQSIKTHNDILVDNNKGK